MRGCYFGQLRFNLLEGGCLVICSDEVIGRRCFGPGPMERALTPAKPFAKQISSRRWMGHGSGVGAFV